MRLQERDIIVNTAVFCDTHVPQEILVRREQLKELLGLLLPITRDRKPLNCWLYGHPGTGKTATARWSMRKLKKETGVCGVYVNCWENPTFFSVLDYISRELRMLGADKLSTPFKLERVKQHLSKQYVIVFLDEIDHPPPKERNAILYNLCDLPTVGIICACKAQYTYFDLEMRVKSRLNPACIFFGRYDLDEIFTILYQRARTGLASDTYSFELLRRIARIADGDARVAIQTLKNAAYLAEKDERTRIMKEHVMRSWNSAEHLNKAYLLRKLTSHHRPLYELVNKNPCTLSGDLWRLYLKTCPSKGLKPIAIRTYSDYCNKLMELGLVQAKRAAIKGKVREFSVAE